MKVLRKITEEIDIVEIDLLTDHEGLAKAYLQKAINDYNNRVKLIKRNGMFYLTMPQSFISNIVLRDLDPNNRLPDKFGF